MLAHAHEAPGARWSAEQANAWYAAQPWIVGCNFIPSTAINQLEMWQADTFDAAAIDRELGWAAGLGMNAVRVYLHDLAWETDADGFTKRMDQYLAIADKHGIRTLFVIFDDCWNADPKAGPQPAPKPGVHNSGWLQSPGQRVVNAPDEWGRLERYLKDILSTFAKDRRVLLWDLYNEPGNEGQGEKSLPLLKQAFEWAQAVRPDQPLSVGIWNKNALYGDFLLDAVDVITFHNYGPLDDIEGQVRDLKTHERPVICTEWLRRTGGSDVASHLPFFKRERVGCFNWGLVSGKTQTIYPWGSKEGGPEPPVWFHDLLRPDGTPFSADEAELFRSLTQSAGKE